MVTNHHLGKALKHLRQALNPPNGASLTDGQLLERFVAGRDEAAFEALVYRHGPMVLGVCRRILRDDHDAEDAFQGTFLVLARKAASVVKRNSVGSWLYAVAYHAALEARAANARRRAREKQVDEMPHSPVEPQEIQDWRPLLDRELAALPEKLRAVVVLCDLEGLPRKEAARRLSVPEGTLSSRLAFARRKLAGRLARAGVGLPAGALAVALSEGAASATVPAALVSSTVRAAARVAAGEAAALATPAAALMKGVFKTMLVQKLKVVAATVVVVLALGAGGLAWRAGGQAVAGDKPQAGKPRTEVEALRREVELLRLNLEVVLEKVRAQEAELRQLRARGVKTTRDERIHRIELGERLEAGVIDNRIDLEFQRDGLRLETHTPKPGAAAPDAMKQAEDAVRALRAARDEAGRRRAADALEKALKALRGQMKPGGGGDASRRER